MVDALAHLGVTHMDIPITPDRVWGVLAERGGGEVKGGGEDPSASAEMVTRVGRVKGWGEGRRARWGGSVKWSNRIGEWGGCVSVAGVIGRMSVK